MCHKCKRKGHFMSQCFSKTVSEVAAEDCSFGKVFLGVVSKGSSGKAWLTQVKLMGQKTEFKLDTGAEVTAVSDKTFNSISKKTKLIPSGKILKSPSWSTLSVSGEFRGVIQHGDKQSKQKIYVVKDLKNNLLGLPAITDLNLAVRMDTMSTTQDIVKKYSSLFQGLGNLGEPYHIKLKDGAKPYAQFTARNVTLPLRSQV